MLRAREYGMGRIESVPLMVPVAENGYCCPIGFGADSTLPFLTSCLVITVARTVLAMLKKATNVEMTGKYMISSEVRMFEEK